jgi:DNA-3-methyladenine glycosylase I
MAGIRCRWPGEDPLYLAYHDTEWGVPLHEDRKLFEFLVLDGFQAGLSWITILRKRENFRVALDHFDACKIVRYNETKITRLMKNKGIVRNRAKIIATIANARAYLKIKEQRGSFDSYLWKFVDGRPICNHWRDEGQIPVQTPQSEAMSRDMKMHGFRFVGPTICYAFMQAAGLVNDHVVGCFRHRQVQTSPDLAKRPAG